MSLTSDQLETVQATVPLLREHGEALATRFYQRMFADYPEVRTFFNQAHQADGRQPRALDDIGVPASRQYYEFFGPAAAL